MSNSELPNEVSCYLGISFVVLIVLCYSFLFASFYENFVVNIKREIEEEYFKKEPYKKEIIETYHEIHEIITRSN